MRLSVVLLITFIVATAFAFYFVWMNRASEKILSAVIPIAVAALVAVGLAVFVYGAAPARSINFPATFIYRASDHLPVSLPYRPLSNSLFLVPALQQRNPNALQDDISGATTYHHLLQRAIFDELSRTYGFSWDVEIDRYEYGVREEQWRTAEGASGKMTKLSSADVEALLAGNKFAQVEMGWGGGLALPPGTKVSVKPPARTPDSIETSSIVFENDYVKLSIKTRLSSWGVLSGGYRVFLGEQTVKEADLREATYIVNITTETKRLRTGNPEMPKYQRWAAQLSQELQRALDEQRKWSETKDSYLFAKQLAAAPQIHISPADIKPLQPPTIAPTTTSAK